jgi:hypothetical protein
MERLEVKYRHLAKEYPVRTKKETNTLYKTYIKPIVIKKIIKHDMLL